MQRSRIAPTIALLGVLAVMLVPAAAYAVGIGVPGATNVWGLRYWAGDATVSCGCHGAIVASYNGSPHGAFFTVADGTTASIDPTMPSYWPSPRYSTGLSFNPADIGYVLGAYSGPVLPPTGGPAPGHEYVLRDNSGGPLSTGAIYTPVKPADDLPLMDPISFDHSATSALFPQGEWFVEGPAAAAAYFQWCGGCHVLGLTRPSSNGTTPVGNGTGSDIGTYTPTTVSKLAIACESCHGAPKSAGNHKGAGVNFLGVQNGAMPNRALDSQACGQCHVSGFTTEKRYGRGVTFTSPNGYSPDQTLAAWNVTNAAQGAYPTYHVRRPEDESTAATMPGSQSWVDRYFYPSGHNKGADDADFNEWLGSGHARSLNTLKSVGSQASDSCLRCHSAEGYLKAKGYRLGDGLTVISSRVSTDKFGIECAVCHTVHEGAAGIGERADCGDCHAAGIAVGQEATAGAAMHAPQKEIIGGYGLIDVPTATAFMPGADCPDCHMPKTHYSRASHTFRAMLPGNAQKWAVPKFGDSCTPCHDSDTRDELQNAIDRWRDTIAKESSLASAAIAAAKTRPTSSTAIRTSLINRASTNWSCVTNDPGSATHNFPYVLAGLKKAQAEANAVGGRLTLAASASTIRKGTIGLIGGQAKSGAAGTTAVAETIVVMRKAAGDTTYTALASVMTNDRGAWGYALPLLTTTSFKAYWKVSGVDQIRAANTIRIVVKIRPVVGTPKLSPSVLRAATRLRISGVIRPRVTGPKTSLTIQRRKRSRWTSYLRLTAVTRAKGSYSAYTATRQRGLLKGFYRVRASYAGDAKNLSAFSAWKAFRVR